uniref:Uncharacterized protein n=1 Tax=Meloidogyne enterolobii TaxID=390850 RepID=A0A6V7VAQ3_MELEN|nr:unnamed protein product [Meloidogyne enterolobii]
MKLYCVESYPYLLRYFFLILKLKGTTTVKTSTTASTKTTKLLTTHLSTTTTKPPTTTLTTTTSLPTTTTLSTTLSTLETTTDLSNITTTDKPINYIYVKSVGWMVTAIIFIIVALYNLLL